MDDVNIYIELPSKSMPHIMAFPITEGGLTKALNVLNQRKIEAATPWSKPTKAPVQPQALAAFMQTMRKPTIRRLK